MIGGLKDPSRKRFPRLRDAGLSAEMDYEARGLKAQMKKAGRANAMFALILGPGEIERGTVTLRRMDTGDQEEVPEGAVLDRLQT